MSRKRSSGEGSVKKLKSGTWRGQLMDGYTAEGKRNIVSFSAPTKSEVLEKMREYRIQMENNVHINKKLAFGPWADMWYRDYESQVQPSTYAGYKYTLALLKSRFENSPIAEILPIHINQFFDWLVEEGYSLSQIRKCRAMLIQIFNEAENNGLVSRNVAQKAKIIRGKDNRLAHSAKTKKDAFTDEEIECLVEYLPENLVGNSIRSMLGSGIRVQELIALSREDIAEDGSVIRVNKAIKMVGGIPNLGEPKSVLSNRSIPIPKEYRNAVKYIREHGGPEFIWSMPGNNPHYSVGTFRRRYYNAIKDVPGVRRLPPHCCRHTYVTQLQKRGVAMELIARLVGHASIGTTDQYLHPERDTLVKAVETLNSDTICA